MSINFNPDSISFTYLTLKRLRDEGFSISDLTDTRARTLMRLATKRIHTFTESLFFYPIRYEWVVNPVGKSLVHTPKMDRIQSLDSFSLGSPSLGFSPLDISLISLEDRVAKVITKSAGVLPETPATVKLSGLFGDYGDTLVNNQVTVSITALRGDTTITVNSAVASPFLATGDVILRMDKYFPESFPIHIDEVDGTNVIKVEPLENDIQAGTLLTRVGSIHADIELASLYLIRDLFSVASIGVSGTANANLNPSNSLSLGGRRLLSESTGRAAWKFDKTATFEEARYARMATRSTGNLQADQILFSYLPNTFYMGSI